MEIGPTAVSDAMEGRAAALLWFVASHWFVCDGHAAGFSEDAMAGREVIDVLVGDGLLRCRRLIAAGPGCLLVTPAGLGTVGSRLPVPRIDLGRFWHDAAVPGLVVSARGALPFKAVRTAR